MSPMPERLAAWWRGSPGVLAPMLLLRPPCRLAAIAPDTPWHWAYLAGDAVSDSGVSPLEIGRAHV